MVAFAGQEPIDTGSLTFHCGDETAPRDGSVVLALTSGQQWCLVMWDNARWRPVADGRLVRLGTTSFSGSVVDVDMWAALPDRERLPLW